jgi:hypothetical protein
LFVHSARSASGLGKSDVGFNEPENNEAIVTLVKTRKGNQELYVTLQSRATCRHADQGGGGMWKKDQHTPNTHNFFFVDLADPPSPSLPNIVCFPSSNVFFECFFVIWIYFFLIHVPILSVYLTINLQDPHQARKCSVHESLLGGTCVGNYSKRRVLCTLLLPPISLPYGNRDRPALFLRRLP